VYSVASQWQQGFSANLAVTNLSSAAWTAFTLRWRYPGGQLITGGWGGSWTQSGQWVSYTPGPWSPPVQPGQTVTVGLIGSGSGAIPPTDFSVNGMPCSS
jgi:endoglucanase